MFTVGYAGKQHFGMDGSCTRNGRIASATTEPAGIADAVACLDEAKKAPKLLASCNCRCPILDRSKGLTNKDLQFGSGTKHVSTASNAADSDSAFLQIQSFAFKMQLKGSRVKWMSVQKAPTLYAGYLF